MDGFSFSFAVCWFLVVIPANFCYYVSFSYNYNNLAFYIYFNFVHSLYEQSMIGKCKKQQHYAFLCKGLYMLIRRSTYKELVKKKNNVQGRIVSLHRNQPAQVKVQVSDETLGLLESSKATHNLHTHEKSK